MELSQTYNFIMHYESLNQTCIKAYNMSLKKLKIESLFRLFAKIQMSEQKNINKRLSENCFNMKLQGI